MGKSCNICHRNINVDKDSYVVVTDYKEAKFFSMGYYHNSCYNKAINTTETSAKALEKANKLMDTVNKFIGGADDKPFTVKMKDE